MNVYLEFFFLDTLALVSLKFQVHLCFYLMVFDLGVEKCRDRKHFYLIKKKMK